MKKSGQIGPASFFIRYIFWQFLILSVLTAIPIWIACKVGFKNFLMTAVTKGMVNASINDQFTNSFLTIINFILKAIPFLACFFVFLFALFIAWRLLSWLRTEIFFTNKVIDKRGLYLNVPYWMIVLYAIISQKNRISAVNIQIWVHWKLCQRQAGKIHVQYPERISQSTKKDIIKVNCFNIKNPKANKCEINLAISDTYLVKPKQIPTDIKNNLTINVVRCSKKNFKERAYSKPLVNKIREVVSKYYDEGFERINILPFTSPSNTENIIKEAFKGRNTFNEVYVYSCQKEDYFKFKKGHRI